MTAVATARTWTIKGVSDRTRDAAHEAAQAEGLTVGEWIDKALARAAEGTLHPRPPAASREDVAEVVRGLLREELAPLAEKVERLAMARVKAEWNLLRSAEVKFPGWRSGPDYAAGAGYSPPAPALGEPRRAAERRLRQARREPAMARNGFAASAAD